MPHKVSYLGYYFPKSYSPRQDQFSREILGIKTNRLSSVLYFYAKAKAFFKAIDRPTLLLCVPPSNPAKVSAMGRLIGWFCFANPFLINGSELMRRRYAVPSLCKGGPRDLQALAASLQIVEGHRLIGAEIIVLDDVFTTGISFQSAFVHIAPHSPASVRFFALGRTKAHYPMLLSELSLKK